MKPQSWYKKEFGLMWQVHYLMDKIADGNKKAAVKKAKDNQKSIVRRAKTDAANDKKFGR